MQRHVIVSSSIWASLLTHDHFVGSKKVNQNVSRRIQKMSKLGTGKAQQNLTISSRYFFNVVFPCSYFGCFVSSLFWFIVTGVVCCSHSCIVL